MFDQFKDEVLSKHYKDGIQYQQSMGFTKNWAEYERFLNGNQWGSPTEKTKNLPRPMLNVISYIQGHKTSYIQADKLKMMFTPEELSQENNFDPQLEFARQGAEKFTNFSETTWERLEQDKLNDELLTSACNIGCGILHYFWDNSITGGIANKYVGDFYGEFIDPSNVFFANPQMVDVQKQPYILISTRELLDSVRKDAKKNGVPDALLETLQEDKDTTNRIYDAEKKEVAGTLKTNVLTEYFKKDGTVWFKKVCNDVIIVPDTNTGLTRYPIALMNWYPAKKNIYGRGDTEGLIPNQKAINFNYAMMLLGNQLTAMPRIKVKPGALKSPITNAPGEVITDYYVGAGDGVSYLKGENFNPMALQLTDSLMSLTKEISGANDSLLGKSQGADQSAQAIALLQKSAGTTLENIKQRYYRCMEDVGRIWLDFWTTKYNMKRPVRLKGADGQEYTDYMVGTEYAGLPFYIKISVGTSGVYSEFTSQSTLDKLFDMGAIDIVTYIKYCSPNSIPYKERLLRDLVEQQRQQMMMGQSMDQSMPQTAPNMTMAEEPVISEGNPDMGIPDVKEPNLNRFKNAKDVDEFLPT